MATSTDSYDYRDYAYNLSPIFLRGQNGERLVGLFGLTTDMMMEAVQQAVLAQSFTSPTFPIDAIGHLGRGRLIPQLPLESDEDYLAVIRDAWNVWAQAGSAIGLLQQIARIQVDGEIKGNVDWDWDGDPANWSRFWVIITNHSWVDDGVWGDPGVWGDGGVWGLGDGAYGALIVDSLRGIISQWKPAHYVCGEIIVVMDPAGWTAEPDGTWHVPGNRDAGAIYIDPTGQPNV